MPFNGAQAGADSLGAIRDAIKMYMDLRSDKFQRERQDLAESRAGRQLAVNEQQAATEREMADSQQQERDRKQLEFMITNFGGQRATQQDYQRGSKLGYGSAFEDEQTLPGRTLAVASMPPGMDVSQTGPLTAPTVGGAAIPQQATGEHLFRVPESEKARIAAYNAAQRSSEGQLNRDNRLDIANIQKESRLQQIRSAMSNTAVMAAAMRYGVDVRDQTQREALAQGVWRNTANLDQQAFESQFLGGNSLNLLKFIGPQGINVPQPPQVPQYYQPPDPGNPDGWRTK